jgi:hypothetical protein
MVEGIYDMKDDDKFWAAVERAEQEEPQLAAPDGTVAIQINDLRALIDTMDDMRDTLAMGKMHWRARWYGSEPERGSAIVTAEPNGNLVAYFGGDENTHRAVQRVVSTHNAMLVEKGQPHD